MQVVDIIHLISRAHDELNALEDGRLEMRMAILASYAEQIANDKSPKKDKPAKKKAGAKK